MKKVKVAFVAAALIFAFSSSAFAALTGKWKCNDGGTYYVRQVGSEVFWYGEKAATSPQWSNVAYGRFANGKLSVRWADVPKGTATGHGTLVLNVDRTEKSMQYASGTGSGFGGRLWTR
uniref:hypothetical protein n=1 Tax=Candidatus Electronema sp. TaxID=2698783 RepID=UPI0040566AFF